MPLRPDHMTPLRLVRDEAVYLITVPDWGQWLDILDRSQRGLAEADRADVDRLLREWVRASVSVEADDTPRPLSGIGALPADLVDALTDAGTAHLGEIEAELDLHREGTGTGATLRNTHRDIHLSALNFAERNACLRGNLTVRGGVPEVNASAYELALVAASASDANTGAALALRELRALPLPLGEALIRTAQALSDPRPEEELQCFAQAGLPHPDLDLAALCLAFGMKPAEAEALPAATAKRLNTAARLLRGTGSVAQPAPMIAGDNVTQILVQDG